MRFLLLVSLVFGLVCGLVIVSRGQTLDVEACAYKGAAGLPTVPRDPDFGWAPSRMGTPLATRCGDEMLRLSLIGLVHRVGKRASGSVKREHQVGGSG
jgi:hypothetical protein